MLPHRRSIRDRTAAALAVLSLLGGCAQGQGPSSETVGVLGGAAAGGVLGSQVGSGTGNVVATGVGAVLGALAGREIAKRLSNDEQERAATAERTAVARNEAITWNSPSSGNRGTIEPNRTYTNDQGRTCREYTHTVYAEGRAEKARGTACQQSDGTWSLVG